MIKRKKQEDLKVKFIGITGSTGKTVVTHLLHHILSNAGFKVGFISSLGYYIDKKYSGTNIDTISKKQFISVIERVKSSDLDFFIIEETLDNLKDSYYKEIELDSGIFTNLIFDRKEIEKVKDHIKFLNQFKPNSLLVIDGSDSSIPNWLDAVSDFIKPNIYVKKTDLSRVHKAQFFKDGMNLSIAGIGNISLPLVSQNNISNLLLAIELASMYINPNLIAKTLNRFINPEGRIDFALKSPKTVVIDKPRFPNSLVKTLEHFQNTKRSDNKIIIVTGSSIMNTTAKELMQIISKFSDMIVLAPQDVENIPVFDINSFLGSFAEDDGGVFLDRFNSSEEYRLLDKDKLRSRINWISKRKDFPIIAFDENHYTGRLDAIDFAVNFSSDNDIVLILGKGNDTSIYFNGIEYEWSDYEAVRLAL